MEENTTTTENNKLSYEQLESIATQLQQRVLQSEAKLNAINLVAMRLDYMFNVLDKSAYFPATFIDKCADEIMAILEVNKEDKNNNIDFPKE